MRLTALVFIALAQLPASPAPRPMPITGIVVDASGRPATDVDVWLTEAIGPDEGSRFGMELSWSTLTQPAEGTTPILVHARSDATGRFTIELPAEAVGRRSPVPMVIWAAAIGKDARVAWHRLPRIILADDPPVRIELPRSSHAEIVVLGPDRKPVAGVIPIRAGEAPIPEPMGRALAAAADADGRVLIAGLASATLGAVRVEAAAFGTQTATIADASLGIPVSGIPVSGIISVDLAPVGRILGRLVAPGGEPIRGVTVRATSQVGGYAASGRAGSAVVACDPQGRFEISAIAAGVLALELEFDRREGTALRGEAPGKLMVQAGRSTEVAIPLRETLNVHGLVWEKGSDRPVAGVKIVLNGFSGGDRFAITDAGGAFDGRIFRDKTQPFGWPVRIPSPMYQPADTDSPRQSMPQRGVGDLLLPPMMLARGADVRGTVVGEDNKPAAGAEVEAIWTAGDLSAQSALARTDRAGAFTLPGVDPLAELSLTAWDGFASTPEVTVRAESATTRPIALTISPRNTRPIGGRVVDPAGRPIAGASVRIWRLVRDKLGGAIVIDPIAGTDHSNRMRTDAEGRYRMPRRFPARAAYYAEAAAPGRLVARSPAVAMAPGPDKPVVLVLRGVGTVEGRVVDRRGQPVAGAVVRQSGDGPMPTESLTASDGRFQLPGVLEGPALIFIEKPGYRFGFVGCLASTGEAATPPVQAVLTRTGEPLAVAYHSLPPALAVEEEKALARRLISPYAETVLARGKDAEKHRLFVDAAPIDPPAANQWLEDVKFGEPDYLSLTRQVVAEAIAGESLDDAMAMIEASSSPNVRAYGYLGLVDVTPNLTPDRRRELLQQAILNSKTVTPLLHRFNVLGKVTDRLIDLGDLDRARALMREAREAARDIRKGDISSEQSALYLTEALARLDLPAALKIVEGLAEDARKKDSDRSRVYERHYSLIAFKVADRSPADAERIVGRMAVNQANDRYIVGVCQRMATKDPDRARRIAESRISRDSAGLRWHALGLIARAIAATDKAAAVRLLDEALAGVERLASIGDDASGIGAVKVGAGLLPAVEQVEPGRLAEFLGRILALRPARGDQTDRDEAERARSIVALAMMVARYDRGLAARLLEPELHDIGTHWALFGTDSVTSNALAALTLVDPKRAVEQVEALPDDPAPGTDPYAIKNRARIYVATLLAFQDTDRWRFVYEYFLYLWTPDQRYL